MLNILGRWSASINIIKKVIQEHIKLDAKFRIIDFDSKNLVVTVQCNATRAYFKHKLQSIILLIDVINNLPSDQACYLGIMLGKAIKSKEFNQYKLLEIKNELMIAANDQQINGELVFCVDRYNNLIFIHPKTRKKEIMPIFKVAGNKDTIKYFSPIMACVIGIFIGVRELKVTKETNRTPTGIKIINK